MPPKPCQPNEVFNPDTKRCIKISGAAFKKMDLSKLTDADKAKVLTYKSAMCKEDEVLNPVTKRCIKKNGTLYKMLVKNKIIQESGEKKCKENEVLNPSTQRCIKKHGALHKKLIKQGQSTAELHTQPSTKAKKLVKIKSVPIECKNDSTFVMIDNVKQLPNNDFIKLSNGYCYSVNELLAYIDSSTFKNINPHNQSSMLFDLEKDDTTLRKHPTLFQKVKDALNKLSEGVDKTELQKLKEHVELLYGLGKTAGLIIFDNLGSFSNKSESFSLSMEVMSKFNDRLSRNQTAQKLMYGLKHPKTNETVEELIESCNKGQTCIHKTGNMLLQVFIYYFIQLENAYNIVYDVSKVKVIFTRVVNNNLYYRQMNSKEIHSNGTIPLNNILLTAKMFMNSSL